MGVAVPALVFLGPSAAVGPHHSYPLMSLGGLALSDSPEVPHLPELPMTFYTSMVTAGTAVATAPGGVPGDPWWHSLYGPNLTGD